MTWNEHEHGMNRTQIRRKDIKKLLARLPPSFSASPHTLGAFRSLATWTPQSSSASHAAAYTRTPACAWDSLRAPSSDAPAPAPASHESASAAPPCSCPWATACSATHSGCCHSG